MDHAGHLPYLLLPLVAGVYIVLYWPLCSLGCPVSSNGVMY
jgi:hypothetical protein